MRNTICTLLLAVACYSCKHAGSEKISHIDPAITALPDTAQISVNQQFINRFEEISLTSMHIVSPQMIPEMKPLSADDKALLPGFFFAGKMKESEVYPLQRFNITTKYIGLLALAKGDRGQLTSVNLMIYNRQKEGITGFTEIAEKFSDARFRIEKQTVLSKDSTGVHGVMWSYSNVRPADATDPTLETVASDYFTLKIKNGRITSTKAVASEIPEYKKQFSGYSR